jgi:HK97 family phage prohead protease
MELQTKTGVALKALDDEGSGLARIATLSAIDSDGDTYAPGAFGEQEVKVVPAHDYGSVPLGKGRVFERGDEALVEFKLNLDSPTAREWHSALKFDLEHGKPLQEWSYGFRILDSDFEIRDEQRIQVLKRLEVFEVSPVVIGAGVGTTTLELKVARSFALQLDAAAAELDDLLARARAVQKLRGEDGRRLSKARIEKLGRIRNALGLLIDEAEAPARAARALFADSVAREVEKNLPAAAPKARR